MEHDQQGGTIYAEPVKKRAMSVNFHEGVDGMVELTVLTPADAGLTMMETHVFVTTYETAVRVLGNLANTLPNWAESRMRAAVAGDCTTCGNHRLIIQHHEGRRPEAVHCPDCHERYEAAKPAFPKPFQPLEGS